MKKILLTTIALLMITLSVLADDKQAALDFFNGYVKSANTYSPTITEMYSSNAKIIRQVVKPDGTTQNVATDTATYIRQMKLGQAGAKLRKYKNFYRKGTRCNSSSKRYSRK